MKPQFFPSQLVPALKETFKLIKEHIVEIILIISFSALVLYCLNAIPIQHSLLAISDMRILTALAGVFIYIVGSSLLIILILKSEAGLSASFFQTAHYVLIRLFPVFFALLFLYIITTVGFLLFIIPGVIFSIAYSQTFNFALIEGDGPIAALKKSWQITKGSRRQLFNIYALFGFTTGIPLFLIALCISIIFKSPVYSQYLMTATTSIIFIVFNYVLWKMLKQKGT